MLPQVQHYMYGGEIKSVKEIIYVELIQDGIFLYYFKVSLNILMQG